MAIISTVPAAITTLQGHLNFVATANPALNVGVYVGPAIGQVNDNFLAIGDPLSEGAFLTGYQMDFSSLPATALRRSEDYWLECTIRTYAGDSDPISRLNDAFTLFNGVLLRLANDPGGSGQLTPSGAWGMSTLTMGDFGPVGGQGWGCVFKFGVHVINVSIAP